MHLYSTNDKIFRLKMKSFSKLRDTRRGTQSYMEKRRGKREIGVTRRRREGIKRGESKLARIWKSHPKHSNINKTKRQRNTQQVKE